jgi:hypothetical protein
MPQIPQLQMFKSLLAKNSLTTNYTLDLPCLNHSGTDCTENLSQQLLYSCVTQLSHRLHREHCFPVSPLVCVRNLLWSLPSNGRCLLSLLSNGSTCYIAPYLRPFVPNSLQVDRHFFSSKGSACDVCDWPCLPSPWLGFCSDYSPTARSLRPLILSSSLIRCQSRCTTMIFFWSVWAKVRKVLDASNLFFYLGRGWLLHNVLTLIFSSQIEDSTVCFLTSSPKVCLTVLLNALLCTCPFRSWFLMPFLHSGCAWCLFPNVRPLWAPCTTLSPPGPWRLCPSRGAGMSRQVNCPQAVTNFCHDSPLPWVYLFGCWWQPTARCQYAYRSSSAVIVFTVASSLGTFYCSAMDSKSVVSIFFNLTSKTSITVSTYENEKPNYIWANVIEMELNTTLTEPHHSRHWAPLTPHLCFSRKATAHIKAIAHVSPNLLY